MKYSSVICYCIVFVICLIPACKNGREKGTERAIFLWKTAVQFDSSESSLLHALHVQHAYIRYFDVIWNNEKQHPLQVAPVEVRDATILKSLAMTPCVFISNDVMANIAQENLPLLARDIKSQILKTSREIGLTGSSFKHHISEILIDCDWSGKTKERFFQFIRTMQSVFPEVEIHCTIRLWQFRNATLAGVPPVDRGLLMCYNLTDPRTISTSNSIADTIDIKAFLQSNSLEKIRYPLLLDVALPIFGWGILFHGATFRGIMNEVSDLDFRDTSRFTRIAEHRYQFRNDTVIGDNYIRAGDMVRVEELTAVELMTLARMLNQALPHDPERRIGLFSFYRKSVNRYGIPALDSVYNIAR